jgi:hypothetical protein
MNVTIYSRKSIESIIAGGEFPDNTAVISFFDPEIKHIDKDYTHVDYSKVCDTVFYCEVDDLDLDYLPEKGYTYDTFFPESDRLAEFIANAYMSGKNIICQCEYGQSRSAGCAAAILEYFYGKGISVFEDYSYYPNQVVYHKVYDALVKMNSMYCNTFEYPESSSDHTTGVSALFYKNRLEKQIENECYHSLEEAYYQLRHGTAKVWVSLHIDGERICHETCMDKHNAGVKTFFRYGDKEIPLIIFIPELITYIKPDNRDYYSGTEQHSAGFMSHCSVSFDLVGIMEWDCEEPVIDKAVITNIKAVLD